MNRQPVFASVLAALLVLSPVAQGTQDAAHAPAAQAVTIENVLTTLADIELRISVDRDFSGGEQALKALENDVKASDSAAFLQDARVVAAVARIRGALDAARKVDRSGLEEAVLRAVAMGDSAAIGAMGPGALDLLADVIQAGKDRQVDVGTTDRPSVRRVSLSDMLRVAFDVDPHRATDMFLDARPALRMANQRGVSDLLGRWLDPAQWKFVPSRRPAPPDARLLDVLVEELKLAKTVNEANPLGAVLPTLVVFDALTPAVCAELVRLVRASPWNEASWTVTILSGYESDRGPAHWWVPSAKPFFEALLDDDRVEARRMAAEALAWSPGNERLLQAAGDADAAVRRSVAGAMRRHVIKQWVFNLRDARPTEAVQSLFEPQLDQRSLEILVRLAADVDAGVREAAARSLVAQHRDQDAALLRALAHDPDAGVRAVLASAPSSSPELLAELLLALSGDTESLVLKSVDERLDNIRWDQSGATFVPVLRARVEHPTLSFGKLTDAHLEDYLKLIAGSSEGRLALSRWSVETGDIRPLRAAVEMIQPPGQNSFAPDDLSIWLSLEPQEIARLVPMVDQLAPFVSNGLFDVLPDSRRREAIASALDPLVEDGSLPAGLRLQLATFVESTSATPRRLASIQALLGSEAVKHWEPTESWERDRVAHVVRAVPLTDRNRMIRELVAEEREFPEGLRRLVLKDGMTAETATSILAAYAPSAAGGEELTRFILSTWFDPPSDRFSGIVSTALGALGGCTDAESAAWLRAGLRLRRTCMAAVEAVGQRPEPEFLADLGDCIGAAWMTADQWPTQELSVRAINILIGKCTLQAGEVLLAKAAGPNSTLRDACLGGVAQIRSYLDSLDDWQERKASGATRDVAVVRLFELMHDPDPIVRAASIRGLATLHAVEHLPEIIEALHDEADAVRQAAREALELLNKPAATANAKSP